MEWIPSTALCMCSIKVKSQKSKVKTSGRIFIKSKVKTGGFNFLPLKVKVKTSGLNFINLKVKSLKLKRAALIYKVKIRACSIK